MDKNYLDINFSRKLIKGKITEAIFEEMFRVAGEYTILPLGYEHTTPMLAQYQHLVHVQKVLDNIRNAPDFALISQDKKSVFLVEVKYKASFENNDILEIASELHKSWNPCFLFVASKENFYYGSVSDIVHHGGEINILADKRVNMAIQQKYLELLKEFIR